MPSQEVDLNVIGSVTMRMDDDGLIRLTIWVEEENGSRRAIFRYVPEWRLMSGLEKIGASWLA